MQQTKDYTFTDDQTGEEVTITGPVDATDEELTEALNNLYPETPAAVEPAPVVSAPVRVPEAQRAPEATQPVPNVEVAPDAADYKMGMDDFMDFSSEAGKPLSRIDQKELLGIVNKGASIDQINAFLKEKGIQEGGDELIAQIEEAREKGTPFGSIRQDNQFEGMVDPEAIYKEYQPDENEGMVDGFFNAIGRSMTEGWADPASLVNAIDRKQKDFFNQFRGDLAKQFPDATEEQLDQYEDEYIAYLSRLRSKAAQEGVKDDALVPWLIGQFAAIEPYDVIPVGRVAKAARKADDLAKAGKTVEQATTLKRVGDEALVGAGVAVAGDLAGQSLAISDGAQDEYDPLRTAASAALTAGIGAGAEGAVALFKRVRSKDAPVDLGTDTTIFAPTAKKGSKAYRKQMDDAVSGIVDKINEVAKDWEDVPEIIVDKNFKSYRDLPNNARGVFRGSGKIHINAEQVLTYAEVKGLSPDDVVSGLVFHEALGHYGLKKKFGEELDNVLDVIYENGTIDFQNRVDDWMAVNPKAYGGSRTRAVEEVLAETSEKIGPMQRSYVDLVKSRVKNFVRDMGFKWDISEREVESIVGMAQRTVTGDNAPSVSVRPGSDRFANDMFDPEETTSAGFRRRGPDRRDYRTVIKEAREMKRRAQDEANQKYGRREEDRYSMADRDIPSNPEELDADTLFEIKNNYEVLMKMTEGNKATHVPMADVIEAAAERGMKPSDILRLQQRDPSTFARKILMHDIAAQKMNEKLNNLYRKIDSGQADAYTRAEFQKTVFRFDDLTNRIFDYQGEVARATRAIAEANYTRKKLSTFREILKDNDMLEDSLGLEVLDDPAAFDRFAKEIMDQLKQTKTDGQNKTGAERVANVLNVPRAVMSSTDLSAPLRQGFYFIGHKEWWGALPKMFQYYASQNRFDKLQRSLTKDPNHNVMQEAGLAFTDVEGSLRLREESYQTDLAAKIPILGVSVKMSERAYVGFLNKLRADLFNNIMRGYLKDGATPDSVTGKYKPEDYHLDLVQQRALATWINAGTGRGSLHAPDLVYGRSKGPSAGKTSALESATPLLNGLFFSPKLMTSRMMLLNPTFYATLPPEIRIRAVANTVAMGVGFTTMMAMLGKMLSHYLPDEDVEVQYDPRSSDFGKVRIGTQRWDVAGGFGQYLTLAARVATGQRLSSTGKEYSYSSSEEVKAAQKAIREWFEMDDTTEPVNLSLVANVGGAFMDFGRNKLSPNASFVVDMAVGEDAIGQPVNAADAALKRMIPLAVQDTVEAISTHGLEKGALSSAPIFFGVGYSDYLPMSLDPKQTLEVNNTFKDKDIGEGENDFASVDDKGVVRLKPEAHDFYANSVNKYFTLIMEQEIRENGFNDLTNEQKEEVISEAKTEARKNGKAELYTLLGVDE